MARKKVKVEPAIQDEMEQINTLVAGVFGFDVEELRDLAKDSELLDMAVQDPEFPWVDLVTSAAVLFCHAHTTRIARDLEVPVDVARKVMLRELSGFVRKGG